MFGLVCAFNFGFVCFAFGLLIVVEAFFLGFSLTFGVVWLRTADLRFVFMYRCLVACVGGCA